MRGGVWWSAPVYLVVGLCAFFLVMAFAWPEAQSDEKVVFRDAVDHVWWSIPKGFLMEPCYEFSRESDHGWLIRCGTWRFRFDAEANDLRPADEFTQRAWDRALERSGG